MQDFTPGEGSGGEETRSGTERRRSYNLKSSHPAWWSADNRSIFPTVNIFIEERSDPAEEMIKKYHASLFFLHIVFVFWH